MGERLTGGLAQAGCNHSDSFGGNPKSSIFVVAAS